MPGSVISSSSSAAKPQFSSLLIVRWPNSSDTRDVELHRTRLAPYFKTVTFVQPSGPTDAELAEAEVIYGLPQGSSLKSLSQVPKLRLIQLASAGSDRVLKSPIWEDEKSSRIQVTTASGVHTGPIPQVDPLRFERRAND